MNTKQLCCLIAFALLAGTATAQVPPCTNYQGDFCYGSLGGAYANRTIATSDGNLVMVGSTENLTGGNIASTRFGESDALILKVSPDGSLIWSRIFGGSHLDNLTWIAELPGGGFLASGYTRSNDGTVMSGPMFSGDRDGWYMRLDADGNELWNRRYTSPPPFVGAYPYFGHFVEGALLLDGAILITGRFGGNGIRIDLDGNILSNHAVLTGTRITHAPDGTYLISTQLSGASIGVFAGEPAPIGPVELYDVALVNVNEDATVNWVKRFIASGPEIGLDLISLSDGYLVLAEAQGPLGGDRLDPGDVVSRDCWLIRTDLVGDILWERSIGSSHSEQARSVRADTDGGFLVVGSTDDTPNGDVTEASRGLQDGWVFKVDALGNKLWDKRWGGAGRDLLEDLIPIPEGYLLVGGSTSSRSGDHHHPDFFLGAYNIWMVQMFPGTPTQWYFDGDGDGLGEDCCPVADCFQPGLSYATNAWDCDDLIFNASTEHLGAPCNDGDWHTINDVIGPACICAGTFVDTDDLTPITVTLWPDFDPGETTWELRDMSTQQIALQGGPYPNGQPGVPESATVLIPPVCNQRFQLFVYDAGANGMQGGRYTLTAGDKRLIDSDGNFQQVSTVSSTLIPISVPVGNIGLTASTCDRLDLLSTSVIVCEDDHEVTMRYNFKESDTGYQFWIFDPHGSYSRRVFLSHKNPGKGGGTGPNKPRYLKLSSLVTLPVPQLKLLNVRVRTRIHGIDGAFGPACTMKIDPNACPITQVNNLPNDVHYSCGQVYTLGGSQRIWAIPKAGVNKYQFQFTDQQAAYVRNIASSTPSVLMAIWNTLPLQPLHVYEVRVRCSEDNGATYCPWGPSCTTYTAGTGRSTEFSEVIAGVELIVFPNPSTDGTVRIQLSTTDALDGPAEITISDMTGRTMMHRLVDTTDLVDRALDLHSSLVSGTYVVSVSCNGRSYRERFMVQ